MSNPLNPLTKHSATTDALSVPAAYRAWAHWCNKAGVGGMQVANIAVAREHMEKEMVLMCLCEVYARAVMEVAIGLHFSHADSQVDVLVLQHMSEMFDAGVAVLVQDRCSRVGPVRATPAQDPTAQR